jgi:hypothetical protein
MSTNPTPLPPRAEVEAALVTLREEWGEPPRVADTPAVDAYETLLALARAVLAAEPVRWEVRDADGRVMRDGFQSQASAERWLRTYGGHTVHPLYALPPLPAATGAAPQLTDEQRDACARGRIACAGEERTAREQYRLDDMRVWREAARVLDALATPDAAPQGAGLTDEQCDAILREVDEIARDYDHIEYGLPLGIMSGERREIDMQAELREAIRRALATPDAAGGV